MLVTSIDNKKVKDWKKLSMRKYRDKTNTFLVEGEHLVLEAYKKGYLKELILEKDVLFPLDIETTFVTKDIINYISTLDTPVPILGFCEKRKNNLDLGNRILLLDGIQDPGNLGTIIRSSVAFNIDTIILGNNTVDLYNSKVIRASQGMIFHINVINEELLLTIPKLQNQEYHIYGTRVTHGTSLKSIKKYDKFALVMGNEGAGISEEIMDLCDDFIYIDMNDVCESLNVGIATSIILYELDK